MHLTVYTNVDTVQTKDTLDRIPSSQKMVSHREMLPSHLQSHWSKAILSDTVKCSLSNSNIHKSCHFSFKVFPGSTGFAFS